MKIILSILFINFSILSYCQEHAKDSIYNAVDVDVKPDFPGGIEKFMKFMVKNYHVPEVSNFKGKVISEFVIEKDGAISEIEIIQDPGYGSGEECIRVLKMSPKWNPGKKNGSTVRTKYNFPLIIQSSE
jgi:protein TonB